ncbi:choice-of-anchor B family protein [Bowmanella sp. JS7-9]|uniref:Choice-of-anchor B family protein n=1 Tax=Pseudobowmanella zhangzhouensis TaxID=1537679 RepID=A0ABW1XME4_9ALTE|nr:choice-of-anchor B family protein [Bowmanella sp. JS7-9]
MTKQTGHQIKTIGLSTLALILGCLQGFSQDVFAHAEHDKARFLAPQGKDQGDCSNRFRPCATLSYALAQVNKGDSILLAAGSYQLNDDTTLTDLLSTTVPVKAGYSQLDQYRQQDPVTNPTYLLGVPAEFADVLSRAGFTVIRDQQYTHEVAPTLAGKQQSAITSATCSGGMAGEYPCDNVDLVAHLPLSAFAGSPSAANDIWGHVDLNTGIEYALIGLRNGTSVVSLQDPNNPVVVGSVSGDNTVWRDIKVYQYYDAEQLRWMAYAYVTADSASDGLVTIDLNNLPDSIELVDRNTHFASAHNVYISNVDYSTNSPLNPDPAQLIIAGANQFRGAHYSFSLATPSAPTVGFTPGTTTANDYSHDVSSVLITDSRAQQCPANDNGCSVLLDFNESTFNLWDMTAPEAHSKLSSTTYNQAEYVHSGWWSEDKHYIFVHDELDESRRGLNTTLRIFDISDLQDPELAGIWTGPTAAIDHNGFVRGNKYYMSNYERGLTILDISQPSNPLEAGFFDTFPTRTSNNFNGAWGVYPYLPSGLILISDINRGLFVLRDNTLTEQSQVGFRDANIIADEGAQITLQVQRQGDASGAASVKFDVLHGATDDADMTFSSGELSWAAGDSSDKTITVNINNDGITEPQETFFVRLNTPQGTQLAAKNLQQVTIDGVPVPSAAAFTQTQITLYEGLPDQSVSVKKARNKDDILLVNYTLESDSGVAGEDMPLLSGTLEWQAGDNANKTIALATLDDAIAEGTEVLVLRLSADNELNLVQPAELTIRIRDDESNQAPIADAGANQQGYQNSTLQLSGNGNDADNDSLTSLWQQLDGPAVTIADPSALQTSVTLGNTTGTATLQLTVTDPFGVQSSDTVSINIQARATPPPPGSSSGGGSIYSLLIMMTAALLARFRAHSRRDW